MLRALELLAGGEQVTRTSLSLGYESPSAFVAAFRRSFGTTPGRYFRRS
jgi:AraC-like DNA-binding protein